MARPAATVPAVKPVLRGKSLAISYNFRGIQFKTPLDLAIEPAYIGATGYVKNSHYQHIELNQQIEAACERYRLGTAIAVAAGDLTKERVAGEYDRLTREAAELAKVAAIRPKVAAVASHFVADEISELKEQLAEKQARYDNLLRAANRYEDDKFVTFIHRYVASQTCSKSTVRSYNAFAKAVEDYSPNARIQDISEDWLAGFVEWLFVTPITIHYYEMEREKINDKMRVNRTNKIKSTKVNPPRVNGTIGDYVIKAKSVLNYWFTRQAKLPTGIAIDASYKNYTFDLVAKQDNVLALSWGEVCELFALCNFEKPTHEMARDLFVLLCSTGLRQSDLKRINPTVIKDGEIHLVTQKTEQHAIEVKIPIQDSPIAMAILGKYDFDIAANAKMSGNDLNDRIKEILNYKQGANYLLPTFQVKTTVTRYRKREQVTLVDTRANLITSHCGRRTFINHCLDNGIDVTDVMLMSGHQDVNTLLVYKNKRKSLKKQLTNLFPVSMPLLSK